MSLMPYRSSVRGDDAMPLMPISKYGHGAERWNTRVFASEASQR